MRTNTDILRPGFRQYMALRGALRDFSDIAHNSLPSHSGVNEWICDNFYLLKRCGEAISRLLRNTELLPADGGAFIHKLCEHYLSNRNGSVEPERFFAFLDAVQKKRPLSDSELTVTPAMLKLAAIDGVNRGLDSDDAAAVGRFISILRFCESFDFSDGLERINRVEQLLLRDPAGVYPEMTDESRAQYRKKVSELAKKSGVGEAEYALGLLRRAKAATDSKKRHIGYELSVPAKSIRLRALRYLTLRELTAFSLTATAGIMLKTAWAFALFLPLRQLLDGFFKRAAIGSEAPPVTPQLEISTVSPQNPVMITVCTLLPDAGGVDNLVKKLTGLKSISLGGSVYFCLLCDLRESDAPLTAEEQNVLRTLRELVSAADDDGSFFVVARPRVYVKTQRKWAGDERKRGAVLALCNAIKSGSTSGFLCFHGDKSKLKSVKYLLLLDSDTGLMLDTLKNLLGSALHILNTPDYSENRTGGYGVFAPKLSNALPEGISTPFCRIMGGPGGIIAYNGGNSDFWQDVFGDSLFTGKGLVNVEAYLHRCGGFPRERILSHDLPEGELVGCRYVGNAELIDGFPSNLHGWLDRAHRWVRGDTQNIIFLFRALAQKYAPETPKLNEISRRKLTESLLTAVEKICLALCLLISTRYKGAKAGLFLTIGAYRAIEKLIGELGLLRDGSLRRILCGSRRKILLSAAQALMDLALTVQTGLVCADAITRALWRSFVSKKHLLEWTAAAHAESAAAKAFRRYFPASALCAAGALFSKNPFSAAVCGLGAVLPFTAKLLNAPGKAAIPSVNSEDIRRHSANMWSFFRDTVTQEDNFLPPDNLQLTPGYALARRTSPTNIGLFLCCIISAIDLGLTDEATALSMIESTVSTLEKLEKYQGHFFNWYDTSTLKPLPPRYISTVDSGNFACCATAVCAALENELCSDAATQLAERLRALRDCMDFRILYNRRRRLFHIGTRIDREPDDSYYDLLMSESRMTGYYLIARRIIDRRHWGVLGRQAVFEGGFGGAVSWSGTMFEYLMPHLFLPLYDGSLAAESVKLCLKCQKKRRFPDSHGVWGISESGFYSFDQSLNYQYKANGVKKLALCRRGGDDKVISPYSAFLALPFDPEAALKNLHKLEQLGVSGEYGFYEAVDFARERTGSEPAVIRSYMAHHLGMSLLSADNFLNNFVWQRRFMSDPEMNRARELLKEKPDFASVSRAPKLPEAKVITVSRIYTESECHTSFSPVQPRCLMLANDACCLILTDGGCGFSTFGRTDVTRRSRDLLRDPTGVFVAVESEGRRFFVTSAPDYYEKCAESAIFHSDKAVFRAASGAARARLTVSLHRRLPAAYRELSAPSESRAVFYLEPVLDSSDAFEAHPAYSKLFLITEYNEKNACLTVIRTGKHGGFALAVGLADSEYFEYGTDRQRLLRSPDGVKSLKNTFDLQPDGAGWRPDCGIFIRVNIRPGKSVCLITAAGIGVRQALDNLAKARATRHREKAPSFDPITQRLAEIALPSLLFGVMRDKRSIAASRANTLTSDALWSFGLSGRRPLMLCEAADVADAELLLPYFNLFRSLRLHGTDIEIAVVFTEPEEYGSPVRAALTAATELAGVSQVNTGGGICLINRSLVTQELLTLLMAKACFFAPAIAEKRRNSPKFSPAKIYSVLPDRTVPTGFHAQGFTVSEETMLPWCAVLANPCFGILVSNKGICFSWARNSRLGRLSVWHGDATSADRSELLLARVNGRVYDLLNGAAVSFFDNKVLYRSICGELSASVEISVPERGMLRRISIVLRGSCKAELAFFMQPTCGERQDGIRLMVPEWQDGSLVLRIPSADGFDYLRIGADGGCDGFTCDAAGFFSGRWNDRAFASPRGLCASVMKRVSVDGTNNAVFELQFSKSGIFAAPPEPEYHAPYPEISLPDAAQQTLFNIHLPNQIMRCRMYGRTGFYQNGGGWGYRDQLQDAAAAVYFNPKAAKIHILRAACRQFERGDVLHWWHFFDKKNTGVRTRYADDMLWLPYAVCQYVRVTGDYSVLNFTLPLLEGEPLEAGACERYGAYIKSSSRRTLFEHCEMALEYGLTHGKHGLPLFGGGDWNDGFNLAGAKGNGESVWLAMFAALVSGNFAELCTALDRPEKAEKYASLRAGYVEAAEKAWKTNRYIRGFLDDGSPFGDGSGGCALDSTVQAFSVLADIGSEQQKNTAISSVLSELWDRKTGMMKLFSPPLVNEKRTVGYTADYPAGVRENGGQYTHGAVWTAYALFLLGRADEGWKLLTGLNPSLFPNANPVFFGEPFSIPADISANPDAYGRNGWNLYTGAAGWYYRTFIEAMLGIKKEGKTVRFTPRIPSFMNEIELSLYDCGDSMHIAFSRSAEPSVIQDGIEVEEATFKSGAVSIRVNFS